MLIRDILQKKGANVVLIESGQTIHDAIGRLNEHGIGALIVTGEDAEVVGIITERDILMKCGQHCVRLEGAPVLDEASCPTLVEDAMTHNLVIGVPDDNLEYVMGIMTKNHIRHLPIMEDQTLVGIISIGDVVNAHLKEKEVENRMLRDYIHG